MAGISSTVAEIIASALLQHDVSVATCVPGFGAAASFEAIRRGRSVPTPFSLHEEVAFAIAHGAALRGTRAATFLKTHGLAKAANAVLAALSCGTTAGLILFVFDDPSGSHSDNILDSPRLLDGLGIPWSRVGADMVGKAITEALLRSERLSLPVALLLDADTPGQQAEKNLLDALPPPPAYGRDIARHLVCPIFAPYQHAVLQARLDGRDPDALARPLLPRVPEGLPEAWRTTLQRYAPLFDALSACERDFTAGDTGLSSLFALPPLGCVDAVCHLGGSVPLAVGAGLASHRPAWAVTGDFSFAAAGHLGLFEAIERHVPLRLVVLHNGLSQATGGQALPTRALELALAPYHQYVRWLPTDASDLARRSALRDLESASDLAILVADVRGD